MWFLNPSTICFDTVYNYGKKTTPNSPGLGVVFSSESPSVM